MDFLEIFDKHDWEKEKHSILGKTSEDVRNALSMPTKRNLEDFKALISPAALPFLEEMAGLSQRLTLQRFGNTMQMYAPMYLSNECQNICTYCGFSFDNKLPRVTLNESQILKEAEAIKAQGFEHILLVTGEANKTVGLEYFKKVLTLLKPHFSNISIEVQPLEEDEYKELTSFGLHSVLVYQETYNKAVYKEHHPKGKKSNFNYRIETPERLGSSGIHKIGLGVLLGLSDWRTDSLFTALHLAYLEKKFWKTKYSISFPRLRPAEGASNSIVDITDKELTQLICAYRIFNPDVELSLSTRESPRFRDNILQLGITAMSAGSKTNPGGYAVFKEDSLEQFEISDERSPLEVVNAIKQRGYEPVWKDWDQGLSPIQ